MIAGPQEPGHLRMLVDAGQLQMGLIGPSHSGRVGIL